jgi:competence protein ComEC
VLLLICIWVYSALCGLSPSILRATVMFSFILIAKMLDRRSNVYNTLAASCFTLLCIDANMLANVGFQLSYMAVLGIVFIQPLIYPWFVSTNWLMDQIWKITSVSIAAQLATSPIGLLYFHQFPNCFLFSNLLIIPLTTVILYACLVLLALSWWPLAAAYLGLGIKYTISFTNWLVAQVEHIPYAYVNGIEIGIPQTLLLYIILFAGIYYFMYQYTNLFKLALVALLGFVSIVGYQTWQQTQQQHLIVYSVNKATAVGMITGKQAVYILDSTLLTDKQKFRFHVQQHVWHRGITQLDTIYAADDWHELTLGDKRIVVSGKHKAIINSPDLLIVRFPLKEEELLAIQPKQVVINGSLSVKKSEQLLLLCNKHHIPAHVVVNSGAFELSL